jgi:hypothetical protein
MSMGAKKEMPGHQGAESSLEELRPGPGGRDAATFRRFMTKSNHRKVASIGSVNENIQPEYSAPKGSGIHLIIGR